MALVRLRSSTYLSGTLPLEMSLREGVSGLFSSSEQKDHQEDEEHHCADNRRVGLRCGLALGLIGYVGRADLSSNATIRMLGGSSVVLCPTVVFRTRQR